jgi:nitroimidazol reductase NimA-like FMN-containing flavoprotein (pyridoxamine 5'-phosphate oxidase superfamily)
MNRQDKEIKDTTEISEILRQGRFATVGLCRADEPYVVTLSYGYDSERNALYFHCAAKGLKLDFIKANPNACATVVDDLGYVQGECSHRYRSVVVWGLMAIVEDLAEKEHAVRVMQDHLERDPELVRRNSPVTTESLEKTGFLRLDIREITGKKSAG